MAGGNTKFNMLLELKTKGQAGLKRMGNSMQGLQGKLKNVKLAALGAGAAFKALAIIASGAVFARLIKGSINQADAFGKLSRQTGIAADTLQSYVNAGKLAGVEQSTIEKSLRRLAQSMREADQGVATYSDAYKALGISVRNSDGSLKKSENLLGELADRFKEMPNGATKSALAMEIFGRSGSQIIPMLNEGSEALKKWNYETSEGFAANAEYFNDQLTMLGFGFDGFKKQLADAVLPALNAILEVFRDVFSSQNDWEVFFDVIGGGLRLIAGSLLAMVQLMEETIKMFQTFWDMGGKILKGDFKGAGQTAKDYAGGVKDRFKENMGDYEKIFTGKSEAGDEYGFKKGTKEAKEFGDQLDKTFGTQLKSKLTAFKDSMKSVGEAMSDTVVKGIKGMEDALVKFVTTGKLDFKSLANSMIADMARIAIQQMITKPLMGMFGFAKGGVFSGGEHLTAFGKGGVVTKPTVFPMADGMGLMGEKGFEAVMPLKRGSDGKLGVESSGGGGTVINVSVDASGSEVEGDEEQGRALGQMLAAAIQSALVQEKRPGGLLAGT